MFFDLRLYYVIGCCHLLGKVTASHNSKAKKSIKGWVLLRITVDISIGPDLGFLDCRFFPSGDHRLKVIES